MSKIEKVIKKKKKKKKIDFSCVISEDISDTQSRILDPIESSNPLRVHD